MFLVFLVYYAGDVNYKFECHFVVVRTFGARESASLPFRGPPQRTPQVLLVRVKGYYGHV